GDVATALADRNHHFQLVMQVFGHRWIRHVADTSLGNDQQSIGRLHEKERRLAARMAHLYRVPDIVASDAIDAPCRERLLAANDRQRLDLRRKYIWHGSSC